MKPDEFSAAALEGLPKFQQLQYQLAAHLRDPQNVPYDNASVRSEAPIETRRIEIYESLLFNNLSSFLGGLFPMVQGYLGENAWHVLIRDFMRLHRAQTPLFHELGEEFLVFLQETEQARLHQAPWLFELAHFEWVELALSIDPAEGFADMGMEAFNAANAYRLSPLAWPLVYKWPVHLAERVQMQVSPVQPVTLLVYRNVLKSAEPVEWVELTPALYQLLQAISQQEREGVTVRDWLKGQVPKSILPLEESERQAAEALQPLLDLRLLASI